MGVCNCKLTTHNVHAGIQHSYEFQPLCQKQNLSCMKTSKTECPETASFLQRAPSLCVKQNLLYEKKRVPYGWVCAMASSPHIIALCQSNIPSTKGKKRKTESLKQPGSPSE